MKNRIWTIEYVDEPWTTMSTDRAEVVQQGRGFYKILHRGLMYGWITKDAWTVKNTGEILALVECMLNDAHELATKEKE